MIARVQKTTLPRMCVAQSRNPLCPLTFRTLGSRQPNASARLYRETPAAAAPRSSYRSDSRIPPAYVSSASDPLHHQNLSHDLALLQQVKTMVDVFKPEMCTHQPIDRKLASSIQLDVPGHVAH